MSIRKIEEHALPYVTNFHTYIDVGAHDGDTSVPLLENFKRVYAFEPNPESVKLIPETVKVFNYALGNKNNLTSINNFLAETITLDSLNIKNVGFININTDNSDIIEGCIDTIYRCKPVIMFESKVEYEARQSIVLLQELGYTIKRYPGETVAYRQD